MTPVARPPPCNQTISLDHFTCNTAATLLHTVESLNFGQSRRCMPPRCPRAYTSKHMEMTCRAKMCTTARPPRAPTRPRARVAVKKSPPPRPLHRASNQRRDGQRSLHRRSSNTEKSPPKHYATTQSARSSQGRIRQHSEV